MIRSYFYTRAKLDKAKKLLCANVKFLMPAICKLLQLLEPATILLGWLQLAVCLQAGIRNVKSQWSGMVVGFLIRENKSPHLGLTIGG